MNQKNIHMKKWSSQEVPFDLLLQEPESFYSLKQKQQFNVCSIKSWNNQILVLKLKTEGKNIMKTGFLSDFFLWNLVLSDKL